jgi:GTPase Era involved in 16S rRNA processing
LWGCRGVAGDAGRAAVAAHRGGLDLHVKVAKDWQRDPKQLRKLGF